LLLRADSDSAFFVAASTGIHPQLASSIRVSPGEGVAGMVALSGDPLLGMAKDGTFLCVPVVTDRGVEGVFNVTDRVDGGTYSVRDLPLARSAAAHIGRLIEYGRSAARDTISGLYSRRAFDEVLERELARSARAQSRFALAFLDLDDLKGINDRLGHVRGDDAIRAVGALIQRVLRPYDVACRYGGDEFVILLTELEELQAESVANGIAERLDMAAASASHETGIPIAISVGIAHWPADGSTADQLIAAADARMYEQKRQHKMRNRRIH
jgi:diguanylate cyclase (GGDEF)-like protein